MSPVDFACSRSLICYDELVLSLACNDRDYALKIRTEVTLLGPLVIVNDSHLQDS